jgi:hypothetical protein
VENAGLYVTSDAGRPLIAALPRRASVSICIQPFEEISELTRGWQFKPSSAGALAPEACERAADLASMGVDGADDRVPVDEA